MLWYGSNVNSKKLNMSKTNNSLKFNKKKKYNSLFLKKNNIYSIPVFYMYIPSIWKYLILKVDTNKNLILYFYSNIYFYILPINLIFIKIYPYLNSSTISFFFFYKNSYIYTFFSHFKKIFYIFSKIFFKKIKFKGKGYYVYKNKRNTIAFRFGYSHIKRFYFPNIFIKFLSKTSIIIFGINYLNIIKTLYLIRSVRPINIFTAKGIRFTRQILYRKTGKISNYR